MNEVSYSDLKRARASVMKRAGVKAPGKGSLDTTTPMVRLGLEVVEFDSEGARKFAREITERNLHRISIAKGNYGVMLFSAALLSGMVYGSAAERRRSGL
jgi:hypothetical protein